MKRIGSACTAALAGLVLAGCGGGGNGGEVAAQKQAGAASNEAAAESSADPASASETRIANRPHQQLMALGDIERRIGLIRAIRATGNRCPRRVEPNPVYQGDYEGMALWTARCDNNEQYAIFIAPNEDVQVRNCRDMAQLRLPPCRELPPAQPNVERKAPKTK